MIKPTNTSKLDPQKTLEGKNILITGTTGFLGKIVLIMLLKYYPNIKHIFVLIRPGFSTNAKSRFKNQVQSSEAMSPLKELYGDEIDSFLEEKVIPINGNIIREGCDIKEEELQLIKKEGLDLIINSAGLVDFDPPIDHALNINVFGTKNIIALARTLNAAILHVSTCFVAGKKEGQILENTPIINQIPQPENISQENFSYLNEIENLLKLAQNVREKSKSSSLQATWKAQAKIQLKNDGYNPQNEKLVKTFVLRQQKIWINKELRNIGMESSQTWGFTNTYTFTKNLGEMLITDAVNEGVNTCIVRPSIIESALSFPFPGWNEGMTTTAPLILLFRQGLKNLPCSKNLVLDLIPIDMVSSVIITASVALLENKNKHVYQVSSGDINPVTIKQIIELSAIENRQYFSKNNKTTSILSQLKNKTEIQPISLNKYNLLSIPFQKKTATKIIESVNKIGYHRFPWLQKPASKIRKIAKNIEKKTSFTENIISIFLPFIVEYHYIFRADNTRMLMSNLPSKERKKLIYAPEKIIWHDYWYIHSQGLEKWVFPKLKKELEKHENTPYIYKNLTELFETITHLYSHDIAFHFILDEKENYLTYGELRKLAFRVAAYLIDKDIQKNDKIILLSENRPEWVVHYFGIILAGATVVPIDMNSKLNEVLNIAIASEAKYIIVSPKQLERLEKEDSIALLKKECPIGSMKDIINYKTSLKTSKPPAKLASIIFTSGTTGKPKGVMLTHQNFTFEISRLLGIFDIEHTDHMLSILPLHHTFEFTAGLLTPFAKGARITYLEHIDGETLSKALKKGVTGLIGVPALWQLLERRIDSQIEDKNILIRSILKGIKSTNIFLREHFNINMGHFTLYPIHKALGGELKYLVSGGSALDSEIAKFFYGLGFDLREGYGLTETSPVLTVTDPKNKLLLGSVGKSLNGVDIMIHNPDNKGVGEILARGPNVMAGYFNDKKATSEVMESGFFKTGDLGRLDEEKNLYIVGRLKDVILSSNGENVYPDELEDLYINHKNIKELSIFGHQSTDGSECVAGLIVPDFNTAKNSKIRDDILNSITQHCHEISLSLPHYKRLKLFKLWNGTLPRTSTRKVKRKEVKKIFLRILEEKTSNSLDKNINRDKIDPFILQTLSSLTKKPKNQIHMNSYLSADLGFDSMMFVELASIFETYAKRDIDTSEWQMVNKVQDLLTLLNPPKYKHLSLVEKKNIDFVDKQSRSRPKNKDENTIHIPKPFANLGKNLITWSQKQFYDHGMKVKVYGKQYIPPQENFIVVANHTSHLDLGLIKTALGPYADNLSALAAKDYFFSSKLRRTYFENFTNVIPIDRHGPIKNSLKKAISCLNQGQNLLIFPEGTRSLSGEMASFFPSLGYIVLTAKYGVLPIHLLGTYEAMPKGSNNIPFRKDLSATIGPMLPYHFLHNLSETKHKQSPYRFVTNIIENSVKLLRDEGSYNLKQIHQLSEKNS